MSDVILPEDKRCEDCGYVNCICFDDFGHEYCQYCLYELSHCACAVIAHKTTKQTKTNDT